MSVFFFDTRAFAAYLLFLLTCWWLQSVHSYVIVNSVSWSVTNEVEEELDSSSTEDVLPSLLEDPISMWKQSYPGSPYKLDREIRSRPGPDISKQIYSPSRMFSYKRESNMGTESPSPHTPTDIQQKWATSARALVHQSKWGFLATVSTVESIPGIPFGQVLLSCDGTGEKSTGDPFFYINPKAGFVSDLQTNPVASMTFTNLSNDACRKVIIEAEDPQIVALTLIGQMVTVAPKEADFVKNVLFSRNPLLRKWSQNNSWLVMKVKTEHVFLTDCYGQTFSIKQEDYYQAPSV
ncbi:hypothetical protein GDO86_003872 [Hymenochirus boettgeri]|uniref:CREG-like beta-barrel domain-containing protein n=1 Tax=Hymenochirus boettgeri TaxID=247094 RepID=A0A8T2K7P7_9PIPI|nr:hypothetical protein GDO86_003872 [Hymenochirus boettgeri]